MVTLEGLIIVSCGECTWGINGDMSCSNGVITGSEEGCFDGMKMDKEGGVNCGNTGNEASNICRRPGHDHTQVGTL